MALVLAFALAAPASARLLLDDGQPSVDAWPAVSVFFDASHRLTLLDVQGEAAHRFAPPSRSRSTLGLHTAAAWLRIPLQVHPHSDGQWILAVDHASLHEIDVQVVAADGRSLQRARLGSQQPYGERPLPGRIHAVPLKLPAGEAVTVFLRVRTEGALILPITFEKLPAFQAHALNEQLLQGLLTGLGLTLVLYSLLQWASLGERLYLKYALQASGSLLFSLYQFGLGKQYLWGDWRWAELHMGGLSALLAAAGTFLFVEHALAPHRARWFSPTMKAGAVVLLATAVAFAVDAVHVHVVSAVIGTLGLAPAVLGLPGALRRARQGDQVGGWLLAAWAGYFAATWVMVQLIQGDLPFNFWTQHSLQFGATLDMLLFLRVITLRQRELHVAAQRARQERESLVTLAHTDVLTGLPNRRGLDEALRLALAGCGHGQLVALFLLDLDGFKAVNDAHGHAAGDELLVAIGRRLRHAVHSGDDVARLGGDEFIVIAKGLAHEAQAGTIGARLLEAFEPPFVLAHGCEVRIGLTIGYALAPLDGTDPSALLQQADAAMYTGKHAGKHRIERAAAALRRDAVTVVDRAPTLPVK